MKTESTKQLIESVEASPSARKFLEDIRAVVILAGQIRPNGMASALGCSLLDLPVDAEQSLVDLWRRQAHYLAEMAGLLEIPLRILIADKDVRPTIGEASDGALRTATDVEVDAQEFRGTGGVLRDVIGDYEDHHRLVVVSGAQLPVGSLAEEVLVMARRGGDVVLLSSRGGQAQGLMVVRCEALRGIPGKGFVDFKEQALPAIAEEHPVAVVDRASVFAYPVRTRRSYLQALTHGHRKSGEADVGPSPFSENWKPLFSIVQPGAEVGANVRIYDSVILAGARVDEGATVVRSVVCDDSVVGRGQTVIDRLVSGAHASKGMHQADGT